ncbi:MAG: tetratricopeptide repeat protein [Candidatus Omnitrophica bacterium]|nr:tetratricopeptide repeat protein [Candidatus Omnitrophota bacterium]
MRPRSAGGCSITAIVCLGALVYANTFHSSFHFDDQVYIVNNPFIRSLSALLGHWQFYPTRFFVFLSLAANYHFNGLHVFGYHVFNLSVHLICAGLVWWLVLLTLATPAMKDDPISRHARLVAMFCALVFVTHPLQTEAVTYIWQRATSMAALFYLVSLCFYVKSRSSPAGGEAGMFFYILSLLSAVIAMFTKENAVTLPLMVLLYEFCFWGPQKSLNTKSLVFLMTILIIPLTLLLARSPQLQAIRKFTESPGGTSPWEYLFTQFRVIVTYIRLLILPLRQNIDYDYSISKSFFEGPVLISFLFLAGALYGAGRLFTKYRLLSFAVLWFFLSLSLESSVLPLKNIIFEHRLYLPLVGYSIFLVGGAYYLLGKNNMKAMAAVLAVIVAFNAVLTYQRNKVWKDELTLWGDAVAKSPHRARAYNNLGFAYLKQGQPAQAIADYNQALRIDPTLTDAYVGRGLSYARQGDFSKAIADYNKAVAIEPDADALNNRGIFYFHQGNLPQAISDLTWAIRLNPDDVKAYYNRGLSFAKQGDLTSAVADYNKAIEIDPRDAQTYYNRGLAFAREKFFAEAVYDFTRAIKIDPGYADAYNNRGITYALEGNLDQAISDFTRALKINPHDPRAARNLAHARALKGS